MDHRELRRLVQLMNDNGLVELEIEEAGMRILLRKAGAQVVATPAFAAAPAAAAHPGSPGAGAAADGAATAGSEAAPAARPPGTKEIVSPMVGTFYRRPSPDSPPYVNVGDRLTPDSVVCIVEAMKVNNEIKAELAGEVVEVLAEDGAAVEFDQPLFRVKVSE
jgi:acetyl-CoA carboxylase biotin carboxyl carrier protein